MGFEEAREEYGLGVNEGSGEAEDDGGEFDVAKDSAAPIKMNPPPATV